MSKDIKEDKIDKINQLNKERKPIMYIEIRHNSLDVSDIIKIHCLKKILFLC